MQFIQMKFQSLNLKYSQIAIKILSASQFATDAPKKDSAKFIKNFESIGTINLQANQSVVNVQLNNAETHLLALICMQVKEKTYEYFLNAYDMQTVSFNLNECGWLFTLWSY